MNTLETLNGRLSRFTNAALIYNGESINIVTEQEERWAELLAQHAAELGISIVDNRAAVFKKRRDEIIIALVVGLVAGVVVFATFLGVIQYATRKH